MTKEELQFVFEKWSSCGQFDCYSLYKGIYNSRRRKYKELALNNQYEIKLCYSCKFWIQKR